MYVVTFQRPYLFFMGDLKLNSVAQPLVTANFICLLIGYICSKLLMRLSLNPNINLGNQTPTFKPNRTEATES